MAESKSRSTSESGHKLKIPTLESKQAYLKAVMYEGVTVLEGTAAWCSQCKAIAPEVQRMVQEYQDKGAEVRFYIYDVDETPDIAQELGVRQMPTFSIFKDGDIMEGVTGARPKEVRKAIEGNL
ncbi:thioredoxin-like protein [Lophiostoma macrostomum CBS 122681]|uniref:Thioredoxin-like protein n=1 Tax=Lophiostoma macrostomum CBS 122681 TaxID=1314788 RepID=A0A6A6SXW9_9PLEO|nr:thioredoxin-like protein [Lophiostoma macrostomum CBS 122681]